MKVSIVGAGNAGCFTALHYAWYTRKYEGIEIELIYNPNIPPERVGQATVLDPPRLLYGSMGFDWSRNTIHATPKTGIVYEGWGKVNEKVSHPFPAGQIGMHYCPWEMQEYILKSEWFNVVEDDVNPKDVDADYVFDCRGKPEDFSEYEKLKNPINSSILAKPNWNTLECLWSRHVATPDGWTFIIPTHPDSPSHDYCVGYLYNSDITSKEDAEDNFLNLFDVDITKHLSFNNYVAKNPVVDDRIILNGNRLFFIEPLESSSVQTYLEWVRYSFDAIFPQSSSIEEASNKIKDYITKVQNFVLWHYQFGSKYDTPFWDYAKKLTFKPDSQFNYILDTMKKKKIDELYPMSLGGFVPDDFTYAYFTPLSFKRWYDGMSRQYTSKVL
tara:strand:- start:185 stop:1339 length:1155 start_codon:yes stop_codon:yes gene_type:complete